jgi:predicted metal-dependent enzyme (double-stranded beta helix superfamily)
MGGDTHGYVHDEYVRCHDGRVTMGSWIVSQILVWLAIIGIILAPTPQPRIRKHRWTVIGVSVGMNETFTFSFNVLEETADKAAKRVNEYARKNRIPNIESVMVVPGYNKVVYSE